MRSLGLLFLLCSCKLPPPAGVYDPPVASTLTIEFTGSSESCEVTASWTVCHEPDFKSYALYRSTSVDISDDPSAADLLCTVTDVVQNTFVDTTCSWRTTYYYALLTTDVDDMFDWSNEVSLTTPGGSAALSLDDGVQRMASKQ